MQKMKNIEIAGMRGQNQPPKPIPRQSSIFFFPFT